jgi:hypothetical protein
MNFLRSRLYCLWYLSTFTPGELFPLCAIILDCELIFSKDLHVEILYQLDEGVFLQRGYSFSPWAKLAPDPLFLLIGLELQNHWSRVNLNSKSMGEKSRGH